MAFKYELKSADGDDLGTFETNESRWQVGDEFRAAGNIRYVIRAIVPRERMATSSTGSP